MRTINHHPLSGRDDSWPIPVKLWLGTDAVFLGVFLVDDIPTLHTLEAVNPAHTRECTITWNAWGLVDARAAHIGMLMVPATLDDKPVQRPMHFFAEWGEKTQAMGMNNV